MSGVAGGSDGTCTGSVSQLSGWGREESGTPGPQGKAAELPSPSPPLLQEPLSPQLDLNPAALAGGGVGPRTLPAPCPPERGCHCIMIRVGSGEENLVQNVRVHFYVLLRKFIQCDCSVASAVKHLNPWLKKGNALTAVCLLLPSRPCLNNKPLFLLPGCSRQEKK